MSTGCCVEGCVQQGAYYVGLRYGKRHGFDKLEERENARVAGIDPNASNTANDGPTAPSSVTPMKQPASPSVTAMKQAVVKEKTKKPRASDDEDSISSTSASDSSEESHMESEGSESDGSESDGSDMGLNLKT